MMKTEIKEYSQTALALDDLKKRLSTVPDYSNTKGYAEGEEGRKELKGYRVALDKKRKELGAEARKHLELINGEAKRINNVIVGLENPFIEAKKAEDEKVERIKREEAEKEQRRVEAIESTIKWMRNLVFVNRTPVSIGESIKQVESIIPDDGSYDEFADAVSHVKSDVLIELNSMMDDAAKRVKEAARVADEAAKQKEQRKVLEAQQAEIDRQKAEQQAAADEEAEKLAKERADFEAEKEAAEKVKRIEAEKVAAAKRQEEIDAAIEKQKAEEAEAEKKRMAEETARIMADRDRFADDAVQLIVFSDTIKILVTNSKIELKTSEARSVLDGAMNLLMQAGNLIRSSDVVQSSDIKLEEDAA